MPTLYRPHHNRFADEIESALVDMVIAHDVVTAPADGQRPRALAPSDLPALEDDGDLLTDPAAIRDRLDTLQTLMTDWEGFGSDACHIEDDGTIC
jgi:hypothetical protein